jgi:heptosyltransferase II
MTPTATQPSKPLVVRIRNWVGDVVLGLPALTLLQQQGYDLRLVARGKWASALLAGHGWPVLVQPPGLRDKVAQLRNLRQDCLAQDPGFAQRENAFLLPVSFSSALEMRLARLRAVGVAKEGRSILLTRAEPWAQSGHELERYWDIACRFLRVQHRAPREIGLRLAPGQAARAAQLLHHHGITGPFVMICPFAGGRAATADKADKKWPAFATFSQQAAQHLGLPVVVYPGPGEHDEARQRYPSATLLEGSDLATYTALLARAALVVANDTGPGHMAAALGRPVISVLGPTNAERWAPWGPGVRVLQKPAPNGPAVWPSAEDGLALAHQILAQQPPAQQDRAQPPPTQPAGAGPIRAHNPSQGLRR